MRPPGFGRRNGSLALSDPDRYPPSWLYPMRGRWLARFRRDVEAARGAGMRDAVFAKVGDSNMLAYNAFYGLGSAEPAWGEHGDLEPVTDRYRRVELPAGADADFVHCPDAGDRRPWNSFSRASAAAMMGIVAEHLTGTPEQMRELSHWWREDPDRLPGESPLESEIRLTRPLYSLIQIGSNGANYGRSPAQTAAGVAGLVARVRKLGSVPVVFTIPPQLDHEIAPHRWDFAKRCSEEIAEAMARERVPLVNLWLALATGDLVSCGLVENDGVIFDGVHLQTYGGAHEPGGLQRSVDFAPEALRYGANFRNLLLLRVLRDLDELAA